MKRFVHFLTTFSMTVYGGAVLAQQGGLQPLTDLGDGLVTTVDDLKLPIFLVAAVIIIAMILFGAATLGRIAIVLIAGVLLGNITTVASWLNIT